MKNHLKKENVTVEKIPFAHLGVNVIYQATVTPKNNPTKPENYVDLCSTTFKERFHNHTTSFKYKEKANSTMLSSHIWDLKNQKIDFEITWKILEIAKHFSPVTGLCNLCRKENTS